MDALTHEFKLFLPSTGHKAWKHFDHSYPSFTDEKYNLWIDLWMDGFNPFSYSGTSYSFWKAFVTLYIHVFIFWPLR